MRSRLPERGSTPDLEGDFPPVLLCARCGSPHCSCEVAARPAPFRSSIAFESAISFRSLWATAVSCSVEPERFFGARLRGPGVGRALIFAVVAELLALGSVFLTLALLGIAVLPSLLPLLVGPTGLAAALSVWVGATAFMVFVHALGGLALLVGQERAPADAVPLVLRFGLYSCGWDLLTSPLGVALALAGRHGPRLSPVWKAASAPRPATQAFLGEAFGLDAEQRRRALVRLAKIALSWFAGTIALFFVLAYLWLREEGLWL